MWPILGMAKHDPSKRNVEAIAARLIASQNALGLSAAEICRRSGVAPNTYSQWINAKGPPRLDLAIQLADALGYTLDWIYFGDPSGLPYQLASKLMEGHTKKRA